MDLDGFEWRKSSLSGPNGGECVEVGAAPDMWRKSRHSGGNGGECVEVASTPGRLALRDSKDAAGGVLRLAMAEFRDLVDSVKRTG
ncbi:DUF397 domain-containing protein [Spirillospora sp. NPDC049652]